MHALHKLQQSFAADLWDDGLNRLDGVILDGRLPAERLFQVYRNNFWISVEDALADIYYVVRQLVGQQFFSFMVDHFLRRFPPRHGNMIQLGSDLPIFLYDFKPAVDLPYLSDVARLEWAYHQVFHAAKASPFDIQRLANIPAKKIPQLHFELSSTNCLINSSFPIFEIWRVNQPDYEGEQSVDLDSGAESVLVYRPDLIVELQNLGQADARFLQSLTTGNNLEKATQAAFKNSQDFDLEAALARYLGIGTLNLVDKDSPSPSLTSNHPGGKQP